jgi:D-alanyl-D-alanine carboxypeptidase
MKTRLRLFHGSKWLVAVIFTLLGVTTVALYITFSSTRLDAPQLSVSNTAKDSSVAATDVPAASSSPCNPSLTHADPNSIDVLVNKKHCLVPQDFAPQDLVDIDGATISAKAAVNFDAMYNAAAAAGLPFSVTSDYRSYSTQIITYNYWVSISGQAGADSYSARPSFSEHQTGLAVDLGSASGQLSEFTGSPQATWLAVNAYKYGFIERYPAGYETITDYDAESWHYRYVGVATATDIHNKGVKTLEQYWGLDGGDYQ